MIYLLNVSPRPLEINMLDSSKRVIKVNDGFTVNDAQFAYYRCFAIAGLKAVSKEEFCRVKGIKLAEPVVEKKVETKEEKPKEETKVEKPKEEIKEPEKTKEETKEPEKVENTEEKPKRGRKPKEETAEN